jgi:hypothetical protein
MGAYDLRLTGYQNIFGITRRNAGNRLRKDKKKMKPIEKFIAMLSTEDIEEICKIVEGSSHAKSLNVSEYTLYTAEHIPIEKLNIYEKHSDFTLLYDPSIASSEKTKKNRKKKTEAHFEHQMELQVNDIIARHEFDNWIQNIEKEYGDIEPRLKSIALDCFLNQDKRSLKEIELEMNYQKELRIKNLVVINNKDAFDTNKLFIEQKCTDFFKNITDHDIEIKNFNPFDIETSISYENERNQFFLLIHRQKHERHLDKNQIINFLLQHFHLLRSSFIAEAIQLDKLTIKFLARKKFTELIDRYLINLEYE